MAITDDEARAAEARMAALRQRVPTAVAAHYDRGRGRVVIQLSTGLEIMFPPRDAQGLEKAKPSELDPIEISPSGLGLHFPKLDADLYLPALLEGVLGSKSWMAARLGGQGGKARSEAKIAAARSNGRKGGRPRRSAAE
jgi:hypothetical protein